MRVALRFLAIRGSAPDMKIAFVAHADDAIRNAVCSIAETAGVRCAVFRTEKKAVNWLAGMPAG